MCEDIVCILLCYSNLILVALKLFRKSWSGVFYIDYKYVKPIKNSLLQIKLLNYSLARQRNITARVLKMQCKNETAPKREYGLDGRGNGSTLTR